MTPDEFVKKWSAVQQNERAAAQSHFNDVCALVGHPTPLEFDPTGRLFSFETQTVKPGGTKGFADVYFHDHFIWEYKGPHKDLQKAYYQLLLYREALGNPPLLVVSDIHRIIIYTNFTNRPTVKYEIGLDDMRTGRGVELLKQVFFNPLSFEPEQTREFITQANANTFVAVADSMKKHLQKTGADYQPEQLAHFMVRILFCLFAQSMNLLPEQLFTQIIQAQGKAHTNFEHALRYLFKEMRQGGMFGIYIIPWFNGSLFDDEFVPHIPDDLGLALLKATEHDWSAIEPSIFGTIFERVIDESKRSQLGAHYTSQADIELIIEPVLMAPLRTKWKQLQQEVQVALLGQPTPEIRAQAEQKLVAFAQELAQIKVLDPACGSGNFLYVALRRLLDLQRDVIAFAQRRNLPAPPLTVSPQQMFGLEINPYAHELAQITVWIGYLQWRAENGFGNLQEPILKSLNNIQRMDAILAFDEEGNPIRPEWPAVDVIIGNPPFLGGNKIRKELGDVKVEYLFELYTDVPAFSDLVCYWFEQARFHLTHQKVHRVGFIATNSISGGINKRVLERIKHIGNIFMAWSDRPWVLDGAAVRIAMVGFDSGNEKLMILDGQKVQQINPDLTGFPFYISGAKKLGENKNICFMGPSPKGPFDISERLAKEFLNLTNPSGKNNQDVVRTVYSAIDLVRRPRQMWTIDFGLMKEAEAQQYEAPYNYVKKEVFPIRSQNRRLTYAKNWWVYAENRPGLRQAISGLTRILVTPAVAKHRIFVWVDPIILCNQGCLVFAQDSDYFMGVLHSVVHETWALYKGTSLGPTPRYTPTTTFETFPFPWPPGREPAADPHYQAISQWAKTLHEWREKWLNPPPPNGSKTVDPGFEKLLKKRTLTNLYNAFDYYQTHPNGAFNLAEFQKASDKALTLAEMEEFAAVHRQLDQAVLLAYGLPTTATEDEILVRLLALNAERAEQNGEITDSEEEEEDEES